MLVQGNFKRMVFVNQHVVQFVRRWHSVPKVPVHVHSRLPGPVKDRARHRAVANALLQCFSRHSLHLAYATVNRTDGCRNNLKSAQAAASPADTSV